MALRFAAALMRDLRLGYDVRQPASITLCRDGGAGNFSMALFVGVPDEAYKEHAVASPYHEWQRVEEPKEPRSFLIETGPMRGGVG